MANSTPPAFHCPSCGALSQTGPGEGGQIVCGECGYEFRKPIRVSPRGKAVKISPRDRFVQRDVVSRRKMHTRETVEPAPEAPTGQEPTPASAGAAAGSTVETESRRREEVLLEDGTRKVTKRRRKKRGGGVRQLGLMLFWTLVVALLVLGVKEFIQRGHAPAVETEDEKEKRVTEARKAEVRTYLNDHLLACQTALVGFFDASDTAGRAQFVSDPLRVTPRMANYYRTNIAIRPENAPKLVTSGLKIMGEEPGIETVWELDEERQIEVVFVREKGKWVLDWEEFVRFGDVPWHRFRAKEVREGEFRLYMRKRRVLVEHDKVVGVQFYPPLEDAVMRQREESLRVVIAKESKEGRLLERHWAMTFEDATMGDTMFPDRDPDDFSRVRVKLAWEEGSDGEDLLVLKEFVSGAWWGDSFPPLLGGVGSTEGEE